MADREPTYLQGLRERKGLSLAGVVLRLRKLDIRTASSTLSRYETGERLSPDPLILWGLAQIYGEPLERLILMVRRGHALARDPGCHDPEEDLGVVPGGRPHATVTPEAGLLKLFRAGGLEIADSIEAHGRALVDLASRLRETTGAPAARQTSRAPRRRTAG